MRQARRVTTFAFLLALSFLAAQTVAHAKSKKDDSGDAREKALRLFQRALAVSDIRATDSRPFALSGVIEAPEPDGKRAKGSYLLLWAAPGRWREEIHFANYSRIRVGKKDGYWQLRSTSYELLPLYDITVAFDYLWELRYWAQPNSIVGLKKISFKGEKIAGAKTECARFTQRHSIEVGRSNSKFETTKTYCFNAANGGLARMVGWWPISSSERAFEYSDFVEFAGKTVPSTIRVPDGIDPTVVFHMSQIVPLGKVDAQTFVPPSGAQEWDSCPAMMETQKLVRQKMPEYPQEARTAHIQGQVSVYAVLGTDGLLHNMKVLSSPAPSLSRSALDALQGWQYQDAVCNGKPVAIEMILKIIYALGG